MMNLMKWRKTIAETPSGVFRTSRKTITKPANLLENLLENLLQRDAVVCWLYLQNGYTTTSVHTIFDRKLSTWFEWLESKKSVGLILLNFWMCMRLKQPKHDRCQARPTTTGKFLKSNISLFVRVCWFIFSGSNLWFQSPSRNKNRNR